MRRPIVRSFGTAVFVGCLALATAGAIGEAAEGEKVATADSQIVPTAASGSNAVAKNLNTIPEDGLGAEVGMGPNNRLVRKLIAARPNEDLIICVAGCFSGRDRVVYAQPIEKPIAKSAEASPAAPTVLNGSSDGTAGNDANAASLIRGSQ